MLEIIMGFVILTCAIALFISFQTATTPKENVILNTTLPTEALNHPRVQALTRRFKKGNLLIFLAGLAVSPPLILVRQVSLQFMFIILWFASLLIAGNWLLSVNSRQLQALKQKNQWLVGNTQIVAVDTEVSRLKKKMPLSRLWFLPSLAIALAMTGWSLFSRGSIYPGLTALAGIFLYIFLYSLSARASARAPSEDTETNLAWTKTSIHLWTLCWVILAAVHTGLILILSLLKANHIVIAGIVGSYIVFSLAAIVMTDTRIRRTQNLLLAKSEGQILVDQDHYWQGGFYNNPQDKRVMVKKRIGYGQTINIATPLGKLAYYTLIIGVPVLLIAIFLLFLSFDITEFQLTIDADQVTIHAPLYGYGFPLEDIQSVATIDGLPGGTRTNGVSTSQYNLGNFRLTGYGNSKMYVYKNQPPYIVVELPDLYIFFNTKTAEQTMDYYNLLLESIP